MARTQPDYEGLAPPWHPGKAHPELADLLPQVGDRPNHVYAAVRAALRGLGLDAERFGTRHWNPLSDLARRGARVVLKPNFIRHWNPDETASVESVVTHGSVIRAIADYAWLAVGPEGGVCIAEAPQHDCDWEAIRRIAGLPELERFYDEALRASLEVVDLRREAVTYAGGVIASRRALPGDPRGYRRVDLGERSAFAGSGLDPRRFRGADYDEKPTAEHHTGGRHEYLLSETVLRADLVVNLPKIKTHKKTGVTLALKNLVGINGDKNWLPHHCRGSEREGGDEFPGAGWLDRGRSAGVEVARRLLRRGTLAPLVRAVRRVESAARGDSFVRSGNWWGNRTTWRMCLDLNRCLYYSDAEGPHFEAPAPVRQVLSVIDGIVAGEGEGPLAPGDRPLGVILASLDPVALDLAAIQLMGFDAGLVPKVRTAIEDPTLRVTAVRDPADVCVAVVSPEDGTSRERSLAELEGGEPFLAHSGWRGHLEAPTCAA
jgi:uncharacterized protein (DUF362 family)